MNLSSENAAFHAEVLDDGARWTVRLQGQITEDSALVEVLAGIQSREIIIDAGAVQRINSCGVRDWVTWIKGLEERKNRLYFVRCHPVVVAQFNMISNFAGTGHVFSVLAPYLCPACNHEHQELVSTAQWKQNTAVPEVLCSDCGAQMEFDEIADSYFDFSRVHGKHLLTGEIAEVLHRVSGGN